MPGRDGKGPQGAGPGTGGRRGPYFADGTGPAHRLGDLAAAGQGRVFGAGSGPGFAAQKQVEYSAQALKNRAAVLECELADVRRRLEQCAGKQD